MSNFDGKVAVVTGGGHGIGKQICVQLAEQGAKIVIADFSEENGTATAQELSEKYGAALFVKADVTSYDDMVNVREQAHAAYGTIDILVLDAGISKKGKVSDLTIEDWDRMVNVNLNGLFYTVKAFYDDFLVNKGSIVYISSGSALSGTGGGVPYPASKAGGEGLIRGLAKELGPKGVNVNAVAPRLINTGIMLQVNYPTEESRKAVLAKVPVGRFGTPEDVANAVVFLADPANSFIQGQTLLLDGGRTIA